MLSEEGLAIIERNADTLLEEVGIEFREHPRALELFKQAFPKAYAKIRQSRPKLNTKWTAAVLEKFTEVTKRATPRLNRMPPAHPNNAKRRPSVSN